MSSPFGSSLLVTGPEALLAQRVVSDVKARALAAQPGADINEINAADLEFSMLSEVVGGSLFASHIVAGSRSSTSTCARGSASTGTCSRC